MTKILVKTPGRVVVHILSAATKPAEKVTDKTLTVLEVGETLKSSEVQEIKKLLEHHIDLAIAEKYGDKAKWCWSLEPLWCDWRHLLHQSIDTPHAYVKVRLIEDEDEKRVLILRNGPYFYVSEEDIFAL